MLNVEKLLCDLIALPSVNPAFVPANDPRAGELRVAEFLAATAAKAGLDVGLRTVLPGRPNLIARYCAARRPRWRILLAPHLDTVNGTDEQFAPVRKRGRIYGRGACDTKGSAAAMLSALCAVAESRRRPRDTEITFAGFIDEENGQAGSRDLAASKFKADLAIVGEPTRNQVVTAHKGNLWIGIETQGKSAHGSRPELGSNAVHSMARIVDAIETGYAAQLRKRRHRILGPGTVNVGAICGGSQPNIVPSSCAIRVDRRTLPGEKEKEVIRELRKFLSKRGLKASVASEKEHPCPPMETDVNLPLVGRLMGCANQRRPAGVNYFCDAAVLADTGIPSVVFGPGDIAQAHTSDEWISIRSLERGRAILVDYLASLP